MPEKLTLTTPVNKTRSEWEVAYFTVDVEVGAIVVCVKDNNGDRLTAHYPNGTVDAAATATLIGQLNIVNLSTKSLRRRLLERLQSDGFLSAGTFSD